MWKSLNLNLDMSLLCILPILVSYPNSRHVRHRQRDSSFIGLVDELIDDFSHIFFDWSVSVFWWRKKKKFWKLLKTLEAFSLWTRNKTKQTISCKIIESPTEPTPRKEVLIFPSRLNCSFIFIFSLLSPFSLSSSLECFYQKSRKKIFRIFFLHDFTSFEILVIF